MEFSDESYVRLYTRKTLTAKLLGWEGRAVMHAMLGEFDAAGLFALRGDPARCIAAVTDLPEAVARVGLERLLETETWAINGKLLVWPTYEHAQNCSRSDRLRQRESRARRLADAVTNRDQMSQAVTGGHTESRLVTECHSPSAPSAPSAPFTPYTTTSGLTTSGEGPETLRLAKALVSSSSDAQSLGSTLAPRESSPESATGIPGVLRKVPADYALPEDIRQDARILGLSDQQIDAYWSELCDGPIGGARGVLPERLHAYLRKLPAKWKVWADVEKARSANTIKRSGALGVRGGSGVVQERPGAGWAPEQRGRMYAERFKLSVDEMARAYRRSLADGQVLSSTELDEGFLKFMAAEVAKKRKVTR